MPKSLGLAIMTVFCYVAIRSS